MWWIKLGFASTRPLKSWRVNLQANFMPGWVGFEVWETWGIVKHCG